METCDTALATKQEIRVLLIEDNPAERTLTEEGLSQHSRTHYIVDWVETLEAAQEKIGHTAYDVLLLDLGLTDSQGLETLNQVMRIMPNFPIIVLTGLKDEALGIEALRHGAQDYLVKGQTHFSVLRHAITYAIERKKILVLKDHFINIVGHELRSPLTALQMAVEHLQKNLPKKIDPLFEELLNLILRNLRRMDKTSSDLLDLASLESGKITLEKTSFDFIDLAKEIAAMYRLNANQRGLELRENFSHDQLVVEADRGKIAQVLINLIGNAFKFTESGFIEIAVTGKDQEIECRVTDSGPGIAAADLPKVFSKFEKQLHYGNGDKNERGSGLGLSICKELIELHVGRIYVESAPELGSSFFFTLPQI